MYSLFWYLWPFYQEHKIIFLLWKELANVFEQYIECLIGSNSDFIQNNKDRESEYDVGCIVTIYSYKQGKITHK